jgi:hypothetical protein
VKLIIDVEKLTPETRAVLVRFAKAATRYHSRKYHKKEFVTVGNEKVLQERIVPRSVETDYLDVRRALLERQDPEIRGILDQLDVTKLLDSLEGKSAHEHTTAHYKMIRLEKDFVKFITKNLK